FRLIKAVFLKKSNIFPEKQLLKSFQYSEVAKKILSAFGSIAKFLKNFFAFIPQILIDLNINCASFFQAAFRQFGYFTVENHRVVIFHIKGNFRLMCQKVALYIFL